MTYDINGTDLLYPRNINPFNRPWEEWAAVWCNWLFSIPRSNNPLSAEIPGKVKARAEALTGPMTPPGKRVQTTNPTGK